ncbi:MAG: hypothetical protein KW788_02650 [Candidatus Doudnabacteria bacterium]|nr:hypothetical protein [Candidatus Doudnabacteria bacterium]
MQLARTGQTASPTAFSLLGSTGFGIITVLRCAALAGVILILAVMLLKRF